MIGVTGATGTIGRALVDRLRSAPVGVRAYSRRPKRADGGGEVNWMEADLAESDGLVRAFGGVERLFLLTGNTADTDVRRFAEDHASELRDG